MHFHLVEIKICGLWNVPLGKWYFELRKGNTCMALFKTFFQLSMRLPLDVALRAECCINFLLKRTHVHNLFPLLSTSVS